MVLGHKAFREIRSGGVNRPDLFEKKGRMKDSSGEKLQDTPSPGHCNDTVHSTRNDVEACCGITCRVRDLLVQFI